MADELDEIIDYHDHEAAQAREDAEDELSKSEPDEDLLKVRYGEQHWHAAASKRIAGLIARLAEVEADRDAWRSAMCSVTPGGSEFARNPQGCVDWVRRQRTDAHEAIKKFVRLWKEAHAALAGEQKP